MCARSIAPAAVVAVTHTSTTHTSTTAKQHMYEPRKSRRSSRSYLAQVRHSQSAAGEAGWTLISRRTSAWVSGQRRRSGQRPSSTATSALVCRCGSLERARQQESAQGLSAAWRRQGPLQVPCRLPRLLFVAGRCASIAIVCDGYRVSGREILLAAFLLTSEAGETKACWAPPRAPSSSESSAHLSTDKVTFSVHAKTAVFF